MTRKAPTLWLVAPAIIFLAACEPASPPSDPLPNPAVPPTTATAASKALPVPSPVAKSSTDTTIPEAWDIQREDIAPSCLTQLGETASKRLVVRCRAVSPATRPPCNSANPCWMIESEIKRGCDFFGPNEKPAECAA